LRKLWFKRNSERVHRCILNLVANAIDDGMAERPEAEKKDIVRTLKSEGWGAEYQVIDNCGGVPAS